MKKYIEYKITVETLEPFRIGAAQDVMDVADNPIATVGGRPVIQGPTLKGALRASVEEYLIEKYGDVEEMKPCIPSSENTLSDDEKRLIAAGKYRPKGACLYTVKNQSKSICPACYLFGAMGLPGFLRIPYLYTEPRIEELYSVRVDRALGTVAEKTNREYQILPDRIKFIGTMEVLEVDPVRMWELGKKRPIGENIKSFKGDNWLDDGWSAEKIKKELIEDRIKSINILGGFKSKGCGKVSITF